MAPPDRAIPRLRLGLKLICASLVVGLTTPFVAFFLSPTMVMAATALCITLMAVGKVFCLSAPGGRAWLLACLAFDFGALLVMFDEPGMAVWLCLLVTLLFLGFLYSLGRALQYDPLTKAARTTTCVLLGIPATWILTFFIGAVCSRVAPNLGEMVAGIAVCVSVLFCIYLLLRGLYIYVGCLKLAVEGCLALENRDKDFDQPTSAA